MDNSAHSSTDVSPAMPEVLLIIFHPILVGSLVLVWFEANLCGTKILASLIVPRIFGLLPILPTLVKILYTKFGSAKLWH